MRWELTWKKSSLNLKIKFWTQIKKDRKTSWLDKFGSLKLKFKIININISIWI